MFQPDKLSDLLVPEAPRAPVADPFSLDALIAWLETKPADQSYCWGDTGVCLFGQWGEENGAPHGDGYGLAMEGMQKAQSFQTILGAGVALFNPHTFGGALARALEVRAEQS